MKKILLAALAALLCFLANAAETVRYTMKYKGEVRTYWLYVPEGAGPATPLVLVLHGYGGSAEGYCPAMLPSLPSRMLSAGREGRERKDRLERGVRRPAGLGAG